MDNYKGSDLFKRYVMLSYINSNKYAKLLSNHNPNISEQELHSFYLASNKIKGKTIIVCAVKSFIKQGAFAFKTYASKFIPYLDFLHPENIKIECTEDECMSLLEHAEQDSKPKNIYLLVGLNIFSDLMGTSLMDFIEMTNNIMLKNNDAKEIIDNNAEKEIIFNPHELVNKELEMVDNIPKMLETEIINTPEINKNDSDSITQTPETPIEAPPSPTPFFLNNTEFETNSNASYESSVIMDADDDDNNEEEQEDAEDSKSTSSNEILNFDELLNNSKRKLTSSTFENNKKRKLSPDDVERLWQDIENDVRNEEQDEYTENKN